MNGSKSSPRRHIQPRDLKKFLFLTFSLYIIVFINNLYKALHSLWIKRWCEKTILKSLISFMMISELPPKHMNLSLMNVFLGSVSFTSLRWLYLYKILYHVTKSLHDVFRFRVEEKKIIFFKNKVKFLHLLVAMETTKKESYFRNVAISIILYNKKVNEISLTTAK